MSNTYDIVLSDGTTISDLRLNGNNYISKKPIDPSIFEFNCSPVTIKNGETEIVHENMRLSAINQVGSEYWFILSDISKDALDLAQLRADIDYIAMMSGIDLTEEV